MISKHTAAMLVALVVVGAAGVVRANGATLSPEVRERIRNGRRHLGGRGLGAGRIKPQPSTDTGHQTRGSAPKSSASPLVVSGPLHERVAPLVKALEQTEGKRVQSERGAKDAHVAVESAKGALGRAQSALALRQTELATAKSAFEQASRLSRRIETIEGTLEVAKARQKDTPAKARSGGSSDEARIRAVVSKLDELRQDAQGVDTALLEGAFATAAQTEAAAQRAIAETEVALRRAESEAAKADQTLKKTIAHLDQTTFDIAQLIVHLADERMEQGAGPWQVKAFQAGKAGEIPESSHDAWSVALGDEGGRVAIADGTSVGTATGLWSKMIAHGVTDRLREPASGLWPMPEAGGTLEQLVAALAPRWQEHVLGSNPMMRALARKGGGGATLAGVKITPTEAGWRVQQEAVGDAGVFHYRDGKLLGSFPITDAEAFGALPDIISPFASGDSVRRTAELMVEPGDELHFATDAVAQWLMRSDKAGKRPTEQFDKLRSNADFGRLLDEARSGKKGNLTMEDDDATWARIIVPATPGGNEGGAR